MLSLSKSPPDVAKNTLIVNVNKYPLFLALSLTDILFFIILMSFLSPCNILSC